MIKKELVFINKEFMNKEDVLHYLIHEVKEAGLLYDEDMYLQAVLKRDEEAPTSLGFEVAIPHGRSDAVKEAFVAYMRVNKPFIWDERNHEKVSSIFLLGVPKSGGDRLHLLYLSQISRHLTKQEFRDALYACNEVDEIYQMFDKINQAIIEKGES